MLLVVTYSKAARTSLRNVCRAHADAVVRRFGRAALFEESALGSFLACRLRAKHGADVHVEHTEPWNEFDAVDADVREAARAYESRENPYTPYDKFAAGTDHPSLDDLRARED